MKVNRNFWILLFLLVFVIIINAYLNDPSVKRTGYLLGAVILFCGFLTIFSSRDFSIVRSAKETRQQVGQLLNEKYEVENKHFFPILWVKVEDCSGISKKSQKIIAWIPGRSKRTFYNLTYLSQRGVFTLGPTKVISGDPFGLFSRIYNFHSFQKIVILPSFEKISSFPEPSGSDTGGEARKARNLEINPYTISVREYHIGDPLKRIQWKYTAKMDKLMSKEFETDPQSIVWILLDGDKNSHFYANEKENLEDNVNSNWITQNAIHSDHFKNSFEMGISLAATLCDYYVNNSQNVGFFSNSQQNIVLAPEGGERQFDKILELLASLKNDSQQSVLDAMINHGAVTTKTSTLIAISSNTSNSYIKAIQQLSLRGFQIILLSIDPSSFDQSVKYVKEFYANIRQVGIHNKIIRNDIPIIKQLSK